MTLSQRKISSSDDVHSDDHPEVVGSTGITAFQVDGRSRAEIALLSLFDQLPDFHRQIQLTPVLQELRGSPESFAVTIPGR